MDVHRSRFVPFPASPINAVAFSRSTDKGLTEPKAAVRLAIGRANGDIEIWNPTKGSWAQETVFPGGDNRSVDGLLWIQEPDDTDSEGQPVLGQLRLFSIGSTPAVTEWNLSTGLPLRASTGNFSDVWCFAAQPRWRPSKAPAGRNTEEEFKGQNIVAGCGDGSIAILSTEDNDLTFKRFLARPTNRKARCMSVVWQDRNTVVAGFADSTIRIYDARNGSLLRNMCLGAGIPGAPKDTLVWKVKCLPDGAIVSGDSNGDICFWDGKTYSLIQRIDGHESDCLDLITSSDGQTVFSGGMDGRLATYKLGGRSGEKKRWAKTTHRRMHDGDIKSMAVYDSKTLSVVVSGGLDTTPIITPLREHSKEHHRRVPGLPQVPPVTSAPSQRLLVSWWEREVCIWRIGEQSTDVAGGLSDQSRRLVARIAVKGNENITSATITADGTALAVSTLSSTRIFQLRPSKDSEEEHLRIRRVSVPSELEKTGAKHLTFSPDGRWLSMVSTENEVFVARLVLSSTEPKRIEVLPKLVELERVNRKNSTQTGLRKYERTIARIAFSSNSSVLVAGDLTGFVDSWLLEGHFDPTASSIDAAARHSPSRSSGGSDADSDSDSDSDDEDEKLVFYGQHWTDNAAVKMLPKLDSSPLVMAFRPSSQSLKNDANGNPGVHPTRQNPHAHSHALPSGEARLLVVTALHQVYEFDMLAGKLTDWSRRNPTSTLPAEFRGIRDRCMGLVWDAEDRAWLYGTTWVGMLDLSQDFSSFQRRSSIVATPAKSTNGNDAALELSSKKRKRMENERWAQLEEQRKKIKGSSGAGDKIRGNERGGVPTSIRRTEDGKVVEVDLDVKPRMDFDDEDVLAEESVGPLDRMNDEEMDIDGEEQEQEQGLVDGQKRKWWCTYKYRPILGLVPIGDVRKEDGEDSDNPLEVVLIERPLWDLVQLKDLRS
ncbi:U3 small nucleolar RNA-associated protein [Zalaria obscura]|uniref:U3 small nucleolar RNA-associated protein n=1 Tax=Zalaria obscura TaxID=2024903 RepID=A0ACC3S6C4_9PEZI